MYPLHEQEVSKMQYCLLYSESEAESEAESERWVVQRQCNQKQLQNKCIVLVVLYAIYYLLTFMVYSRY